MKFKALVKLLKNIAVFSFLIFGALYFAPRAYAIVDPLSVPNNKFGIHIISASDGEASPAAELVNSGGGDWGYVTVLTEDKDRSKDKWQAFFNDLRRRHLIPLVRIASEPEGGFWKVPSEDEAKEWANFLDSLIWPTKNRYVIIYNEPNQGQEWGGKVDATAYAKILDETIIALKNKNPDFFVLNAGFDASSPNQPPKYEDELAFLKEMNGAVPGIFNKLDGWVSHSYPNPGFVGSPDAQGRGSVKTYEWEIQQLKSLGLTKDLPIFITETGWKHAEGVDYDKSLPSSETVAQHLTEAFANAWSSSKIVTVTPFLLDYQDHPFDHFSFKKLTGPETDLKILGVEYPQYYPQFLAMKDLPKISGHPVQENKAELVSGSIYPSIVSGESYTVTLVFKNIGESIWNENQPITLRAVYGGRELTIDPAGIIGNLKVEPGQTGAFKVNFRAPQSVNFNVGLQLYEGDKPFDQPLFEFQTRVKSPVILKVNASLKWKREFPGEYILSVTSDVFSTVNKIILNDQGSSEPLEVRYLLPDHDFKFTLQKPFYKPKTLDIQTTSGVNTLNFGELQPDFWSALLIPPELWKLLPFSR